MKFIITEEQQKSLLASMLSDIFKNSNMKYEGEGRNFYVNGGLMMQVLPTKAILDNTIFEKSKEILFYDTMNDFKDAIKKWIISEIGISDRLSHRYGISFKNLLNLPEQPKERKKSVKEKKPPKEKKSDEQKKREREGYSNFLKHKKEQEELEWQQKQERIKQIANKINKS